VGKQTVQDDIQISLQAQKVITHETVRLTVSIQAQVDPAQSETDFRIEVQTTLRNFVETEWKIQSIQRSKSGKYENVYVSAMARIPEGDNHHLHERVDAVSRIGFELTNPQVDYSLSFDDIQKINKELRLSLMAQALDECNDINKTFKANGHSHFARYRISSSRFDNGNNQQLRNTPMQHGQYALTATMAAPVYGGALAAGANMMNDGAYADAIEVPPADLNVSTRFSMTGTFVLRAVVND